MTGREAKKLELRSKIKSLNEAYDDLVAIDYTLEHKHKVGTCWKLRQSYGCTRGPAEYWFVYVRVKALVNNTFQVLSFERSYDGRISIYSHATPVLEHYDPCSEDEYQAAWLELCLHISQLTP